MLAAAAAERGFAALACTDTNGVYGAVEFQRACEAAGVRPILGAHLVTGARRRSRSRRTSAGGRRCAGRSRGFIGRRAVRRSGGR